MNIYIREYIFVLHSIPIWFHPGGKKDLNRLNNTSCSNCLRDKHGAVTVGHVLKIVQKNYVRHYRRRNCACESCRAERAAGCDAPYKCYEEAVKILDCLNEKWDPRSTVNQPNPELTEEEAAANVQALDEKEPVIFNPNIKIKKLADGFRIF
ncbi:hypothetical protein B0H16DRAFT_1311422, partial [Mycena metata]